MGILSFLAKRFVAGETLDSAMKAIKRLNDWDILATVDHLGENVSNRDEARLSADAYLDLLDEIYKTGVKSNVSIKLTMMGLEIDPEFCFENVGRIIDKATDLGNFVRIDMEGSPVTKATLDLYDRMRESCDNIGIVIQSYLYRSEEDIRRLAARGDNVRLCKGAYKEAKDIAFQDKADVNENFLKLAEILLSGESHTAIASHDRKMIEPLREFIRENGIPKERYEFQMLYGIERDLQKTLAREGEKVRVYVPYGTDWLGYFSRRMMERRENLFFAVKHFFRG